MGTEGDECAGSVRRRLLQGGKAGLTESFAEPCSSVDQGWQGCLVRSPPDLRTSPHPTPDLLCGSGNGPKALFPGYRSVKLVRSPEAKWKRESLGIRKTQGITPSQSFPTSGSVSSS